MTPQPHAPADDWAEHVLTAALGAMDTLAIHVGDRLGWYRALADWGPLDSDELADRTGTAERYAREWLEHQATGGMVEVHDREGGRAYSLPPGATEALTDEGSLAYIAPLARMLAASAAQMPAILEAYRTGGGVSWDQLGDDARWSQAALNRPWFESRLATALADAPHVHAVLARPHARIADVACGAGWSAIALARAYPDATVLGVDIDGPSIERARANAVEAGLADRVEFVHGDAGTLDGTFDGVFVFEALHDMPRPVAVLAAIHDAVRPDGVVVVMDEGVAEDLVPHGDELERLMYGFSLLVCLPDGMSSRPSVATGTVLRPSTLRAYAEQAGFTDVSVLPIEDFSFFRFYELHRAA